MLEIWLVVFVIVLFQLKMTYKIPVHELAVIICWVYSIVFTYKIPVVSNQLRTLLGLTDQKFYPSIVLHFIFCISRKSIENLKRIHKSWELTCIIKHLYRMAMKMNILVFSAYQSFRPDVTVSLMLFFALQHIFDVYSTTQMIFVKSSHISRVIALKDSDFFF